MDLGKLARELKPYIQRWVDGVVGALHLDDILDVNVPVKTDGTALIYDAATDTWVNRVLDPTTTSGDLIVLYGTDTTNYAASANGATATASSAYSGYVPANAIDSNDATFWASAPGDSVGAWIYIDFGFLVTIGRFRVKQDAGEYTFKIQHSADHVTWTDDYTTVTTDGEQTGAFTGATGRYWRFLCLTVVSYNAWNIYTIELYSPAGVHTLVPLHAVANIGYVLGIGADGFPAYLPSATPAAHKTSHENGGADEISVAGLSGELADAQTPKAHNQAATTITVADAGNFYTGTEAETVLQEVGTDNAASIHDNVAGEIDALTALTLPVMEDVLLVESSAASFAKRELSLASLALLRNDAPLNSATEGDHFCQYASGSPTGWNTVTAATPGNTTANKFSYWYLAASTTYPAWEFNKQTGVTVNNANDANHSFYFSQIQVRDHRNAVDEVYSYEVCADNAGTIDKTKYARVELMWDASQLVWKARGVCSDGSTTETGDWYALSFPLSELYVRIMHNGYSTRRNMRMYISYDKNPRTQTILVNKVWTTFPTLGQVWRRIECARGSGGVDSYHYMGAMDYDTGNG